LIGFGKTLLAFVVLAQVCIGFAQFISAFCDEFSQALTLITPFNLMFYLLGGLMINVKTIPKWLVWIEFVNPVFYTIDALA